MEDDPLHRAKTYPYPIPDGSFIFRDGAPHYLGKTDPFPDVSNHHPVLAVGSNQSPEQLMRKFGDGGWSEIPVVRIELAGFDSVYSPHIASYGAIAATLCEAPGVTVALFVTWLDDGQLVRMHDTEISSANYGFGRLSGLRIRCEAGPSLDAVYLYVSSRGTLSRSGNPIPVAEISAQNRTWPAMDQLAVQRHVRDRLSPKTNLDAFITASIDDGDLRRQRSDALKEGAGPFAPLTLEMIPI